LLSRYLHFLLKSGNEHSIHSPFVYELYTKVICRQPPYYVYESIESLREQLLISKEEITVQDLGAGSKVNASSRRKIKQIARYSLKNKKTAQLLFRLVNFFQPKIIFDLGTSLGISTLYLAAPNKNADLYTFEGCPQTMALARKHFKSFGYHHVKPVLGNINQTLELTLNKVPQVDLVFFDANHRREPTLAYFTQCLTKAQEHTVFIFDDIYWSAQMQEAWKQIRNHPSVMLTIDLFEIGLVFFRKNQPKQHFILRF
jgi:predicted O-methyltransferase YrrM